MGRADALQLELVCKDWGLIPHLWAIVFDTTATNTGNTNGACTIFESELLKMKLLWLACRHHVDEVVLRAVFERLFGKSSAPTNPCFTQFRDQVWPQLDTSEYSCLPINSRLEKSRKAEVVKLYVNILRHDELPRGDYKEAAVVSLQLLGEIPPQGVKWFKPGGTHNARWMTTILYASKIYGFSKQLDIDKDYLNLYERFCLFCSLYYVPWWLSASKGIDAPVNDLEFWNAMQVYHKIDKDVASAALYSFENHLWYLSEELTPLCLFSAKVNPKQKSQIAKKIMKTKGKYDEESSRGQTVMPVLTTRTKLVDLVGPKSWTAFSKFVDTEWLQKPVNTWQDDPGYETMFYQMRHLKVVNDLAERGVKLVSDFAKTITHDEDQKQCLYQVVEDHRRKMPKISKQEYKTYDNKLMTIY